MREQKIYLAGKFLDSGNPLEVENPYTGKPIAKSYHASQEQLEQAIKKAINVRKEMQDLPSFKKYEILSSISSSIYDNRDSLTKLLSSESAKPIKFAMKEVMRAVNTFRIAAEEAKRIPKEYLSLDWSEVGENKEGFVKHFPIGPVSAITPFNFPLNLVAHKIAPAIAAGCPLVLKPDDKTPLTALALCEIIDDTELPKGALSVLPMDHKTAKPLIDDGRFKLLSFTGSDKAGWTMKKNAGKKKVILELGGNAACIITKSANIENAVERCLIGGFAYSGQVCIHTQRIYVDESIFDTFKEKYIEKVKSLKEGDPLKEDTDLSVMIDEAGVEKTESWVKEAIDNGAEYLLKGKRKGLSHEPVILTNTNEKMKVNSSEVFGPVVVLEKFSSFSEAVDLVNNTNYGLQAGVFTDIQSEVNYGFNNLKVGGVLINEVPTFRVDHMPYGGIRDSGLGREGLKYSIMDMTEPRLLIKPVI